MILQTCDPTTNDFTNWVTIKGLIKFRITRSAGSRPSSLVAHVAASKDEENNPRFWPFLGIRVVETDTGYHKGEREVPELYDAIYFAGRIDSVYLKEDIERGRVWEINARCWLSVYADNTINEGFWSNGNAVDRGKGYESPNHYTTPWKPSYLENYGRADYPWGEFRKNIIWDLCWNIIAPASRDSSGSWVDSRLSTYGWYSDMDYAGIPYAYYPNYSVMHPNSLPVQVSFTDKKQSILQAIQQLAASDPWCDQISFKIDAITLARSSTGGLDIAYPRLDEMDIPYGVRKGIGGDLQCVFTYIKEKEGPSTAGRALEYIPRGWRFTGFYAYYGKKPEGRDGTPSYAIAEMDFGKDGLDIYTLSTAGTSGNLSGTSGSVASDSLQEWDPAAGKFRMAKTKKLDLFGLRDDLNKIKGGEQTASEARVAVDAATAEIFNTSQSSNGGIYRGNITISGRPKNLMTLLPLRPAEIIKLHIPQIGVNWAESVESLSTPNTSSDFVVEQFAYEWPDEKTIIEVTRQHPGTLVKGVYEAFQNVAEYSGWDAVSPWIPVHKAIPPTAAATPVPGMRRNKYYYLENYEWKEGTSIKNTSNAIPIIMISTEALVDKAKNKYRWELSTLKIQWLSGVSNIDTSSVEIEYAIWDGFTRTGKFTLSDGTNVYRDYHAIQETVTRFNKDRLNESVKVDKENMLYVDIPETLDANVSFMTPEKWANINTKWLTGVNEGPLLEALPYPIDPAGSGWVTRNTGNLLIRIKVKKKT